MKGVYPVFIKQDHDMYLAYIADIDAMTQGKDLYEAGQSPGVEMPGLRSAP
ncbi:MAG: hypothetical protein IJ130_05125 [Solobacterium sp.]|nr:hypothetical protein [Solobacterium sp.]